jgi:predicted TIM-barrel fold metal-dependent hydrolase
MVEGKYYVIDAHCHVYPDKIAPLAVKGTDTFYGLHSHLKGTVTDLFCEGHRTGVDKFIVQSLATTPHQVKSINEFISKCVAESGGRLIGLGTMHPESADMAGDVEHLIELGLHGVKLHADIQGFCVDDEKCKKIYKLCENKGLPVLMHAGDKRYDRSNPNRIYPVLKEFPNLTVIAAHLGGWSVWQEAVDVLAGLENLYVDTCSSFCFLSKEEAKRIIYAYGTDRVLFGTDYPMWRADEEIEYLLSLGLKRAEYESIFAKNAIRAYKIIEEE